MKFLMSTAFSMGAVCTRKHSEYKQKQRNTKVKENNSNVEMITTTKPNAKVIIHLAEGQNLPAMDLNGNSDCYAIINIGNRSHKSKVVTSLNPQWNESFIFDARDIEYCNYVMIEIFDQDTLSKDDKIGMTMIHFTQISTKYFADFQWITLHRSTHYLKSSQFFGKIRVKIEVQNVCFHHDKIYKIQYDEYLLPLLRKCSFNPMLSKSSKSKKEKKSNPQKLQKCVGYNAVPNIACNESIKLNRTSSNNDSKLCMEYPIRYEKIKVYIDKIMFLFFDKSIVFGDIFLTNFRIIFNTKHKDLDYSQQIFFGSILKLKLYKNTLDILQNTNCTILQLQICDGRKFKIVCSQNSKLSNKHSALMNELYNKLRQILNNIDNDIEFDDKTHLLYAKNEQKEKEWKMCYDASKDFERQRLNFNDWKAFRNVNFSLCATYPSMFYVPSNCNEEMIKNAASFRSKQRLPVLVWHNYEKNNFLLRCSQPSGNDTAYVQKLRECVAQRLKSKNKDKVSVIFFDCRTKIAAAANTLKGKGTENVNVYGINTFIHHLNIGNIHCVRKSFDALIDIVYDKYLYDEHNINKYFQRIANTEWNQIIFKIIAGANKMALELMNNQNTICIVHCSDGWDRTSQISALSQLLIDGYYRTIDGFITLVEKEWILFGHKFNERNGFLIDKKDERSPIFLQFLECVWQIMQIYTSEFEFTADFIVRLAHHSSSNWFGNFLYNSQKERSKKNVYLNTQSLWLWPVEKNKKYDPKYSYLDTSKFELMPIFFDYYLYFDEMYSQLNVIDDDEVKSEATDKGPDWMNDDGTNRCCNDSCKVKFSVYKRKHHCRSCGKIFCHSCSEKKIVLKQFGYKDPVRVCDDCYQLNSVCDHDEWSMINID